MSSELLTPKQRIDRAIHSHPKYSKRGKSDAALVFALLIGAIAAFGIIIVASNDPNDLATGVAPTAQLDGRN
jgi:hypothetical protein